MKQTFKLTAKQAKQAERKARDERLEKVIEAASDERKRFNLAIQKGLHAYLDTAFGFYRVLSVDSDFWYHTVPMEGNKGYGSERSFCGCNDDKWADLLAQVGEPRDPLFAD